VAKWLLHLTGNNRGDIPLLAMPTELSPEYHQQTTHSVQIWSRPVERSRHLCVRAPEEEGRGGGYEWGERGGREGVREDVRGRV
jgi:hypothetical protein